jgi:hypothetical protein
MTAGTSGASAGTPPVAGSAGLGGSSGAAGSTGGGGSSGAASGAGGTPGAGTSGGGSGGALGGAGSGGAGAGGVTSAGTAGQAGSTAGGGAGGAGGSAGGGSNVVVSDDFEGAMIDSTKWELGGTGQGSIALSTEQKHGGSQSVKVVVTSGPKYLINRTAFPLPAGVIHFRVWMHFANADWANHIAFIQASPGMESQEVRFGGQANAYHANLAADGDGLSPNPFAQPSCELCLEPVAATWVCLRGKLDFPNSDAELYVNDTLAVDAKDQSDWHSGTGVLPQNPNQIGFGWALYGGPMNTVYYDDLAIGYEPIPCQ